MDPFAGYQASAAYHGTIYVATAARRNAAVKAVRKQLKRASVRGLLCHAGCNIGLRNYANNPVWLQNAADYIQAHLFGKGQYVPVQPVMNKTQ